MEGWYLAKLFPLWYYEFSHVSLLCLDIVCKCSWWCRHLIILCIVESSNNELFQVNLLLIILTLFVMLHFQFLWLFYNSIYFGQDCKYSLGWTTPMLFLFIYNLCKLKWWHHGHLATPSIVTSLINDLIQVFPCHLAFIVVLQCCFKNM
jgi:hypothetical protein